MAPIMRVAVSLLAIMHPVDSWGVPHTGGVPHTPAGTMSLRLADRKTLDTSSIRHATGSHAKIFGTYGDFAAEDRGKATLLVIPAGAEGDDVLLKVSAMVEKIGSKEEDVWIRRVQVRGKWLEQSGKRWSFKTGSGFYGDPSLYQARLGDGEWTAPVNLLKASDGLLRLAIHDKDAPTHMFQSSVSQDVHLVIGPVTLGVKYATSNKDGVNFNHLDVHLSGLKDVVQDMGGVLITGSEESASQVTPVVSQPPTDTKGGTKFMRGKSSDLAPADLQGMQP